MLLFNFIFSNISLLYFLVAIFLVLFNVLGGFVFVQIYIGIGIISYVIKAYLETDAMTKAFYVAKEYMEETAKTSTNITKEEVDILLEKYGKVKQNWNTTYKFLSYSRNYIKNCISVHNRFDILKIYIIEK